MEGMNYYAYWLIYNANAKMHFHIFAKQSYTRSLIQILDYFAFHNIVFLIIRKTLLSFLVSFWLHSRYHFATGNGIVTNVYSQLRIAKDLFNNHRSQAFKGLYYFVVQLFARYFHNFFINWKVSLVVLLKQAETKDEYSTESCQLIYIFFRLYFNAHKCTN